VSTLTGDAVDWVAVARALQPLIEDHAEAAEQRRAPSPAVIGAMAAAGLFRVSIPAAYGGAQADPITTLKVIEAIAEADGATGWNLMVGLEAGLVIAAMDPSAATRLTTSHPNLVMCGSFAPLGHATITDDGVVVNGRWPYASGCTVADYFCGACVIDDPIPGSPDDRGGTPVVRQVVVPRAGYHIEETWEAAGLTATGSHDVIVTDALISHDQMLHVGAGPRVDAAVYRLPLPARLSLGKVGVATGIARHALDQFTAIATTKIPATSRRPLRESAAAQLALAEAEARLRSGRAFALETIQTVWDATLDERPPSPRELALLRLACATSCRDAVTAVDLVAAHLGMTASLGSPALTRTVRDVRVVPQHAWVAPAVLVGAGRALLGLDPDTLGF
jgi:alkylation response protein AidB-like acyl-CoA dehydrogenase